MVDGVPVGSLVPCVDFDEVAGSAAEVTVCGSDHRCEQVRGEEATMSVGREDRERNPPGVDVEFHGADTSGTSEKLSERFDVQSGATCVDHIPVRVDADTGTPHVNFVVDGPAPERTVGVGESRNEGAVIDDEGKVLTDCTDLRSHGVVTAPKSDIDVAVGVNHE